MKPRIIALACLVAIGCGPRSAPPAAPTEVQNEAPPEETTAERPRVAPPESGPARDVHLPPLARTQLTNGLEIDVVPADALPLVYVRLVIKSGLTSDPANLPGLSRLVANMLKEGTRRKTSQQLAEAVEYLGADLYVDSDQASITLQIRALADHLDEVLGILADMAQNPRFDEQELRRLKQRELDRLRIEAGDPATLARTAFYRELYGVSHPYAHIDASPEGIARARGTDLVAWHRQHFVPSNAYLVVVGAVDAARVQAAAQRVFGTWRGRPVTPLELASPPARTERQVVVVHRPGSAQSVIAIGNLAIARADADWVPLAVANQVLGGSAASRLFQDLRERRSLTYGAYSSVDEQPHAAPFRARAAIGRDPRQPDLDRTAVAMDGFMEHLQRIVSEAPPENELESAKDFLSDSFPLAIDTAGRIANLVADLRLYGLSDDYWDTFRTQIRSVTAAQALAAAQRHIDPAHALVVVVGDAEAVAQPLRVWGPVRVVSDRGEEIAQFPAQGNAQSTAAQSTAAQGTAAPTPAAAPAAEAPPEN